MKKILLVDDESYILDLLEQLIPWEFYGFEIIGKAESAGEAIKIFHREHPDVIITDICMDQISGIEFITRIRMQDTHVKIMILSAYDKFEYAQKALKLNVNGYLLKPVNKEELLNALIEVQAQMENESGYHNRIQNLQNSLDHLQQKYLEEKLMQIYREELSSLPEELNSDGDWCVLSIKAIVRNEIVFLEQDLRNWEKIENYILFVGDGLFAVFLHAAEKEWIRSCLLSIRKKYCDGEKSILCGVSSIGDVSLSVLCRESKDALDELFYQKETCYGDYARNKRIWQKTVKDFAEITQETFLIWIAAGKKDMCQQYLWKWSKFCRESRKRRKDVLTELEKYLEWMKCSQMRRDAKRELEEISEQVSAFRNMDEVEEAFKKGLEILEVGKEHGKAGFLIGKAQEYMKEYCCREEFSIEELAEHLHLSKSYLSKLYKEETGEPIWNFVIRVRITRAKELLIETDNTNFAIAKEIGYTSEYHFSRVFSKMVGVSPSVYKKMYMNMK